MGRELTVGITSSQISEKALEDRLTVYISMKQPNTVAELQQ